MAGRVVGGGTNCTSSMPAPTANLALAATATLAGAGTLTAHYGGVVTVDATGTADVAFNGVASVSFTNITVGASATALCAVLCFATNASGDNVAPSSISVTWNGVAMTQLAGGSSYSGAAGVVTYIFGLVNPASGKQTLSASWTGSCYGYIDAISFDGTGTTNATAFKNGTQTDGDSAAPSITITSLTADYVLAAFSSSTEAINSVNDTELFIDTGGNEGNGAANYAVGASSGSVALSATLAGTDYWSAAGVSICPPSVTVWQGTAILAGLGSLSEFDTMLWAATATLVGVGNLIIPVQWQATAILAGIGSVSTSASLALTANALLVGVGSLSVSASLALTAHATLVGAGTLSEFDTMKWAGTAVLAGIGTLSTSASLALTANATLAGSTTLSSSASLALTANATLAGASTLIESDHMLWAGFAILAGAGSLTESDRMRWAGFATLAGAGTLSASATLSLTASAVLAGIGTLSAAYTTVTVWQATATLTGTGALSTLASLSLTANAVLTGTSSLSAYYTTVTVWQATATLSGTGTVLTSARLMLTANAILAGASALSSSASLVLTASAVLAGTGTLSVSVTLVPPIARPTTGKIVLIDAVHGHFLGANPYIGEPCALVYYVGPGLLPVQPSIDFIRPDGTVDVANPAYAWVGNSQLVNTQGNFVLPPYTYMVYLFARGELDQTGVWTVVARAGNFIADSWGFTVVDA